MTKENGNFAEEITKCLGEQEKRPFILASQLYRFWGDERFEDNQGAQEIYQQAFDRLKLDGLCELIEKGSFKNTKDHPQLLINALEKLQTIISENPGNKNTITDSLQNIASRPSLMAYPGVLNAYKSLYDQLDSKQKNKIKTNIREGITVTFQKVSSDTGPLEAVFSASVGNKQSIELNVKETALERLGFTFEKGELYFAKDSSHEPRHIKSGHAFRATLTEQINVRIDNILDVVDVELPAPESVAA